MACALRADPYRLPRASPSHTADLRLSPPRPSGDRRARSTIADAACVRTGFPRVAESPIPGNETQPEHRQDRHDQRDTRYTDLIRYSRQRSVTTASQSGLAKLTLRGGHELRISVRPTMDSLRESCGFRLKDPSRRSGRPTRPKRVPFRDDRRKSSGEVPQGMTAGRLLAQTCTPHTSHLVLSMLFPSPESRVPAPGSRLPAPGSRLPAPGSRPQSVMPSRAAIVCTSLSPRPERLHSTSASRGSSRASLIACATACADSRAARMPSLRARR